MSFLTPTAADIARRAGLRRMRTVAVSLLILAAVIYLATLRLDHGGAWGYVNTAAEAAMVGALADWFAVTALFKHPLGLPIPHTAIIPKRKNELGRNLQEFVTDNFLTEEIARERLAAAHVGQRFGAWLAEPANRHRALIEGRKACVAGLNRMRDDEVRDFVTGALLPRLSREPVAPIAGSLLEGVVQDGSHRGLVELAIGQLRAWLADNPGTFHDVIGERAPWWTPPWVDERVINWTYAQILTFLDDLHGNPDHPGRLALDDLLARLGADLQSDPEVMARAEALKERLLAHPQVPDTAVGIWQSLRHSLLEALDDESSYLWQRADELLKHVSDHLLTDHEWRARLEGHLADAVAFGVNTYGAELAEVISATVDRWDGKEASDRIQLFVGRDLQFIRINGTIVGALAGLVIHALSQVFA